MSKNLLFYNVAFFSARKCKLEFWTFIIFIVWWSFIKQVIKAEITEVPGENFQDLLNLTDFRGRQENILILKDKLNELQNRIKELEDGNTEKSPEDLAKSTKVDKLEERKKLFQNKKVQMTIFLHKWTINFAVFTNSMKVKFNLIPFPFF